jgi:two-component system sensor histidine kinase AtoS
MESDMLELVNQYFIFFLVAGVAFLVVLAFVRRISRSRERDRDQRLRSESHVLDSLQGVIQSLKDKEQQLESMRLMERERADDSLALSENIIESISSGVFTFDSDGRMVNMNLPASTVLARDQQEMTGVGYRDLFSGCPEFAEIIRASLEEGRFFSREEIEIERSPGDTRYLGVSASPLRSRGDEVIGSMCLFTDLTEIRQLQDQVRLRENLARLGEMSAGIAHEFRNGLAAIQGYAQLVNRNPEDGRVAEHAGEILKETRTLGKVVSDFLAFARPASLRMERIELGPLLEECLAEVTPPGEDDGMAFSLDGDFPAVNGDETLLRQAFLNLLRNARQAVRAVREDEGEVRVRGAVSDDGRVGLEISDNGVGIEEQNLDRIFLPFFTTREEGTGLGLALVQKIILSHNGTIQVNSRPGEGTSFRITLPPHQPELSDNQG